ncbi:L-aspartate oxidase [Pseudalkalibacillus hwajinpoensis]|uniref:L-aspartate oxidase n=1 Tax=Guptibacillus hwajinpoensis TaxID=208199 RepID=UPI00325A6C27
MTQLTTEVLVIGSGIAGLMAADLLSAKKNVTIITKSALGQSNSRLAQGGIAAVTTKDDSWTNHFFDTIRAGAFHNDEELTELLVRSGPEQIRQLINFGVQFDKGSDGTYLRCKEGAHNTSRILHSGGDATGKEIIETLINRVKMKCTILEHHFAVDLLMDEGVCNGAVVLNGDNEALSITAIHTILATGGAGQLYPVTSNDPSITGDGIAIAYRAGAILSDLEFIQFHPTMFAGDRNQSFLISEAVRGEGAILVTAKGDRLMKGKHEQMELAPRDVVSRAIYQEKSDVYLDISMINQFDQRFPTIASLCYEHGLSLSDGKLPVKPGAHFLMGGVMTDRHGRTSIDGLLALGEVANTGVHGANRLASNSLLEGVVFANAAARWIQNDTRKQVCNLIAQSLQVPEDMPEVNYIKELMNRKVGIIRNGAGLNTAIQKLEAPLIQARKNASNSEEILRYNMLQVSWLIATSAYLRIESRGGHFRKDYPNLKQEFKKKRIIRRVSQDDWVQT